MLDIIRQRWGAMVESGNRTFRESWQIIELTSLCHAWGGTPTFDLSTEILGIKPLEPGFRRFCVAPQLADLAVSSQHLTETLRWIGVLMRITLNLLYEYHPEQRPKWSYQNQ